VFNYSVAVRQRALSVSERAFHRSAAIRTFDVKAFPQISTAVHVAPEMCSVLRGSHSFRGMNGFAARMEGGGKEEFDPNFQIPSAVYDQWGSKC